jgi:hypothetical protein
MRSKVKMHIDVSHPLPTSKGLRQDGTAVCVLFIIALEKTSRDSVLQKME